MTKIKLCGLTKPEEIQKANELLPDYIGFVFAKKSKRAVSFNQAKLLKRNLNSNIKAVGVFVDENKEEIKRLCDEGIIDVIQLHGMEDNTDILEIKKLTKVPVIKAFRMDKVMDLSEIENSLADMVLIDSSAGSGACFDWSVLKNVKRPFILAGGLNPDNIFKAVTVVAPYGVDVSSGIETDGIKDLSKMEQFVKRVRGI